MSSASEAATSAAGQALQASWPGPLRNAGQVSKGAMNDARSALRAAHDPSLGLDRSVRLGDVVALLRTDQMAQATHGNGRAFAYFLERKLGGSA